MQLAEKRSELAVLEGEPATGAYPDYSAAVGGAPRAGVPVPPMSTHETPPPPPGENTASHIPVGEPVAPPVALPIAPPAEPPVEPPVAGIARASVDVDPLTQEAV